MAAYCRDSRAPAPWYRVRQFLAVLLLASGGMMQVGCSNGAAANTDAKVKAVEVQVAYPLRKDITDYEVFTGRLEAVDSVDLRARVTGYLQGPVNFQEGALVEKGQPLFEIDPRTYRADLDRAEAGMIQAQVHLKRLEQDYQRALRLIRDKAMSQEEFDKVVGDRAEAEAGFHVARANRDVAKVNFDFTKITAPLSGRISRRLVDPGNLVKADDTILASIVSLDPIYVYFDIDERTLLKLRRMAKEADAKNQEPKETASHLHLLDVKLGLSDEDSFSRSGKINFVDNKLDALTGTLRERAEFRNPDGLLSPGMFARIRLPLGPRHPALLVPEKALGTDQGRKFLFVVNDKNVVEYRRVNTGSLQGAWRVIEDDGVKLGERIVVSGLQRVRQGTPVNASVIEETPPPASE